MTVPVHGLPSLVREGLEVAVVPPALRGSRWHTIASCSSDARRGTLVSFGDVRDLNDAERLVGRYLLARASELPADLALHDAGRLLGRTVLDSDTGDRGVIEEVMTGPANDVWVILGERGRLLVPVIDQVVSEVPEEGPISISVPAGLSWEGC